MYRSGDRTAEDIIRATSRDVVKCDYTCRSVSDLYPSDTSFSFIILGLRSLQDFNFRLHHVQRALFLAVRIVEHPDRGVTFEVD